MEFIFHAIAHNYKIPIYLTPESSWGIYSAGSWWVGEGTDGSLGGVAVFAAGRSADRILSTFDFAITNTEQKSGADLVTMLGMSGFLKVL